MKHSRNLKSFPCIKIWACEKTTFKLWLSRKYFKETYSRFAKVIVGIGSSSEKIQTSDY